MERGPGAAYHMFVVMEDLVEKLKLLRYEEGLLRKSSLKPPSRWVPATPVLAGPGARPPRSDRTGARLASRLGRGAGARGAAHFAEKVNKSWNCRQRGMEKSLLLLKTHKTLTTL